jgi:hypothetical protein
MCRFSIEFASGAYMIRNAKFARTFTHPAPTTRMRDEALPVTGSFSAR